MASGNPATAARLATRRAGCQSRAPMAEHRFPPATGPLTGRIAVPGDKSISHRALMLGALAVGETRIDGLLESEDVRATAAALQAMGAVIEQEEERWSIHGVGTGGLLQPDTALDMGNSGTSARLLMGLIASHGVTAVLTGDASLSRRPMGRVIEPLSLTGAQFAPSLGGTLPLRMEGTALAAPVEYRLPVPSAQVKSALLLAGLNARGRTTVIEPVATRDHTERMLAGFGVPVAIEEVDGERHISVTGEAELAPQDIAIPGDPSSAAFFIVAALLVEGSDLTIANVGLNPTRAGLIDVLRAMGGRIDALDPREVGGEPVADLRVRHSPLTGIEVDPAARPLDDRRVPDPVRRRRAGRRAHCRARAGRTAREGKRPVGDNGRRAHRDRRAGGGAGRRAGHRGHGRRAARGRWAGRDEARPPDRDEHGGSGAGIARWRDGRRYRCDRDEFSGVREERWASYDDEKPKDRHPSEGWDLFPDPGRPDPQEDPSFRWDDVLLP